MHSNCNSVAEVNEGFNLLLLYNIIVFARRNNMIPKTLFHPKNEYPVLSGAIFPMLLVHSMTCFKEPCSLLLLCSEHACYFVSKISVYTSAFWNSSGCRPFVDWLCNSPTLSQHEPDQLQPHMSIAPRWWRELFSCCHQRRQTNATALQPSSPISGQIKAFWFCY